jgi:predicted GNAT family acetyltransferase
MIELQKYTPDIKEETVTRIACFFDFHAHLTNKELQQNNVNYAEAEKTLDDWISSSNELYVIKSELKIVGFIHIGYRGGNVAWIEDIFVDEPYRNKGIATESIEMAEEIIKSNPNYDAICIDVVPRNEVALQLYYKLGYDSLSMITIRKELYENKRDKIENILGLEYKI